MHSCRGVRQQAARTRTRSAATSAADIGLADLEWQRSRRRRRRPCAAAPLLLPSQLDAGLLLALPGSLRTAVSKFSTTEPSIWRCAAMLLCTYTWGQSRHGYFMERMFILRCGIALDCKSNTFTQSFCLVQAA